MILPHTHRPQIKTRSPLATLYQDTAVLENHHAHTALSLLDRDGCGVLDALSAVDQEVLYVAAMCFLLLRLHRYG